MRAIDLIIFDCDGVLIDSELISSRVMIDGLRPLGVNINSDYVAEHFVGRSFPTVARLITERFQVNLPDDFEQRYRTDLLAAFEAELQPTLGIAAVLQELMLRKCVATSSSPQRAARSLQIAQLAPYFGANVFTASQVAHGKPAPDLFLFAAAKMQADPSRCLIIEDSLIGVQAGLAAGMQVCRYVGGGHLAARDPGKDTENPAVRVFSDWAVFDQVLAKLQE